MKLRGMFGALAGALLMAAATPAMAGLDFVNTATADGSVSTPEARFNGVDAATLGTIAMPSGFLPPGPDQLTVTSPTAAPLSPQIVEIDFAYTNPDRAVKSYANGDGRYDLVVQLGTIAGTVRLNSVRFRERDSLGFTDPGGIGLDLTSSDSDQILFIDVAESDVAAVLRDDVEVVRLQFIYTGSTPSFAINAVANPEPGTIALFGLGLVGLAGVVRRRRRNALPTETA